MSPAQQVSELLDDKIAGRRKGPTTVRSSPDVADNEGVAMRGYVIIARAPLNELLCDWPEDALTLFVSRDVFDDFRALM